MPFLVVSVLIWPISAYPALVQFGLELALASPFSWLAGFFTGHLCLAALLLLGKISWWRLKLFQGHPLLIFWALFLSTTFASVLAHAAMQLLGNSTPIAIELLLLRFVLLLVSLAGMGKVRQFRVRVEELESSERQLLDLVGISKLKQSAELEAVRERMRVLVSDLKKLAGRPQSEVIEQLRFSSERIVRPWSHELAQSKSLDIAPEKAYVRPDWAKVWDSVFATSVLKPFQTAFWVSVFSLSYSVRVNTTGPNSELPIPDGPGLQVSFDAASFGGFLLQIGVIFIATFLAGIAVRAVSRSRNPLVVRLTPTRRELLALLMLALLTMLNLLLLFGLVGLRIVADLSPILLLILCLPVGLIGLAVILSRALSSATGSIISQLEMVTSNLRWQVARANQELWTFRNRLANQLHGPIRSALISTALRLGQKELEVEQELNAAVGKLEYLTEQLDDDGGMTDPLHLLFETRELWRGVCGVELAISEEDLELLRSDEMTSSFVGEIVSESVSNAVVHGGASEVRVDLSLEQSSVKLTVADNGSLASEQKQGLGSKMLSEAALNWSLSAGELGTVLVATLPFSPVRR